jgi:hypothetical protein
MTTAHKFKITKEQAGAYTTCCGDEIRYYTSDDFGLPASAGWYTTDANGDSALNRFSTFADAKGIAAREHTMRMLDIITECEKVGA